jgi:two-component system sensor histidine kinase KdpD
LGQWRFRARRLAQAAVRAALGCAVVALVTAVWHEFHANFPIVSFVYLLIVVLQSLAGDFLSAVMVSLAAVACLDFFFVEPVYTLMIARSVDAVALLSFLLTALVITQLVTHARTQTRAALRERERLDRLYRLSRRLLGTQPEPDNPAKWLELFLGTFGSTAVCLFDADKAQVIMAGTSVHDLPKRTRDAYVSGRDVENPETGVSVRRLEFEGKVHGAVGFENLEEPKLTSGPLAILMATLVERGRALLNASEAAAATQAEVYRSAILDALAHEFKTPLSTILTAAGGLSEAGGLNPEQTELAELVETEAARLGGLTSRLLRIARLDREEVRPRLEYIDVTAIVEELARQQARRFPDRHLRCPQNSAVVVQADLELLRLAISQLLENACKYSSPGSIVSIQLEEEGENVAVRVTNTGSAVSPHDQSRIFERFYRGVEANAHTTGSGLGLYVARKIATAHGGRLVLESDDPHDGVTFRLTIPSARIESDRVVTGN